jgi:hypothetical protein
VTGGGEARGQAAALVPGTAEDADDEPARVREVVAGGVLGHGPILSSGSRAAGAGAGRDLAPPPGILCRAVPATSRYPRHDVEPTAATGSREPARYGTMEGWMSPG